MSTRIFLKFVSAVLGLFVVALFATDFLTMRVARADAISELSEDLFGKAKLLESTAGDPGAGISSATIAALGPGSQAALVRGDGTIVISPQKPELPLSVSDPEVVSALTGTQASAVRTSASGVEFLSVAVPVAGSRAAICLAIPTARADQIVNNMRLRMIASTALALFPVVLIAALLARRTSSSLGRIIGFAGELANGNFHSRLQGIKGAELGLLSTKLNETSAKLERTVQQLQTEHAELEKLERIRKDFVINVSHELRTPLASIQGYTETLMDGALYDPDHNLRFLEIIRHNAERLALLTGDLLTLSRIEMKTQQLQFASYRVNAMLDGILDTMRPIAAKKDVRLVQDRALESTEVFCDSEAVYQIVSNLLDNAIKYTPRGGVITVGVTPDVIPGAVRMAAAPADEHQPDQNREESRGRTANGNSDSTKTPEETASERVASPVLPAALAAGPMIEIFVRDTGMGIPEEDLPRLFERFYRVDKARSRELGGTGLGLAIVKHLVRTHGGDVRVTSVLHRGSVFYFTLPVEDPSHPTQAPAQSKLSATPVA